MKTAGNFTFRETAIPDVWIIEPKKYGDERGYFSETYRESDFQAVGLNYRFVQDNQSRSKKGVLRGLHFQKTHPQAKLVRCRREGRKAYYMLADDHVKTIIGMAKEHIEED